VKNKVLLVVALLVLLTPASWAADKWYVGLGAGSSDAELPGGTTHVNFDDTGYFGYFGYRILRNLSAELSYTDFGSPSATVGTMQFDADVKIAALWAVGILPLTPRLDLFGRLGYSSWDTSIRISDSSSSSPPQTQDDDGYDLGWSVGIGYNFTPRWGLQLDWDNYEIADADKVTFTGLSVHFRF